MLDLSTDIVRNVIERAREFHGQESVTFPEPSDHSADDWARQVLASHTDDLSYQEVRNLIRELEPDQQISLVALMWMGRGDFEEDEWEEALETARDRWNERTAEYLLSTPLVADYLEEGLEMVKE